MGYNTTVVVLNDALADIENDQKFGAKLAEAIRVRELQQGNVDVPAGNHGNAAHVVETHHADQTSLITVGGNLGLCHLGLRGWRHNETDSQVELLKAWAAKLGYEVYPTSAPKGRKKTTGRFATREELCERVWFYHQHTNLKVSEIARNVKVSVGVVDKILETNELRPDPAA